MILAAGLGTRLKPWTEMHPKALAPVNGQPLLERNIRYLQRFGIYDVIVNVHHFSEQVIQAIDSNEGWGSRITISDETAEVLETGGGLQKASWFLNDEDFVLMNVDVLTDLDLRLMLAHHCQQKVIATLAVSNRKTTRYFLFNEDNLLCGWRNVKTGEEKISRRTNFFTEKAFSGIHVLSPRIFNETGFKGKFSMVELYLEIAKFFPVGGFDHSGSKFIDVGKPESILQAEALFD